MIFTAHIREADGAEQSVEEHCKNTAALAERFAASAGLGKTARLAGLLHDIGKLSADFNDYIHGRGGSRRGDIDHSFAGARYLREHFGGESNKTYEYRTAALVGRVILTHHGLCDWLDSEARDVYDRRTKKDDRYEEIADNLRHSGICREAEEIFPAAVCEVKAAFKGLREISGTKEVFGFYLGMLERFLLSCLIDADRTDTADFLSLKSAARCERCENSTEKLWEDMTARLEEKLDSFSADNEISKRRRSISDRCFDFAAHDVGICRLLVPTGGGKTLSSLRFAIRCCKRHGMKRIVYTAPFMSILEQNSDVMRSLAGEEAFLEHHSNMLAEVSSDADTLAEYELRCEKWDSPVIATTMVQLLNSLFSAGTSAVRRMHRLSETVLIIDEVQSLPIKCVYLFNLAMNFLTRQCGSSVVLCSATQPPFEDMAEFSLLLDENASMSGEVCEDFKAFDRTELIYKNDKEGGFSYDEAANFCYLQFAEHGSLLVVVNTKQCAAELYQRLSDRVSAAVFHLSTNMCPEHRRSCIYSMKKLLSERKPVICVTTQLIEAGVDISFGCAVRSLAGLDNAVQTAGRCNRNGEFGSVCPVFVIDIWEESAALRQLGEIKNARDASRGIFACESGDYASVGMQREYFKRLYSVGGSRAKLRYSLRDNVDVDLINLLSLNKNRIRKRAYLYGCGQAFKTAGRLFEVIESGTREVIVPYDDKAKELIAALCAERDPYEALRLLRQAQRYAVSIYPGTQKGLDKQSAIYECSCGGDEGSKIMILNEEYYDKNLGVTTSGAALEVLVL